MGGSSVLHDDVTIGYRRGQHPGPRLNPVWCNCIFRTVEVVDSLNPDNLAPGSVHPAAHLIKQVSQFHDFRFTGGVFNGRNSLGHCRRHHQVFRCPHTRKVEGNP